MARAEDVGGLSKASGGNIILLLSSQDLAVQNESQEESSPSWMG